MKNVYVGNLPRRTTEAEMRDLFQAHGAVKPTKPSQDSTVQILAAVRSY